MALRLHIGPHDTVTHDGLAILGQERRDDGVKRALSRRNQIGRVQALGIQTEGMTPVLQANAKRRFYSSRAKAHIVALNEADHHAIFIRCAQVDGSALDRVACAKILRMLHVDELGA